MPKSPRQRRHQKTRQKILEIARQMIIETGHEEVSLRAVARQADYSPAGLYEYFSSKEDLIGAISMQVSEEMVQAIIAYPDEGTPSERLLGMCLGYIQFALENRSLYTMMSQLPSRRGSLEESIPEGSPYNIFLEAVKDIYREKDMEQSSLFDAEEVTYGLWSVVHGMASLRMSYLKNFEADFEGANLRILQKIIHELTMASGEDAK